MRKAIFGTDWGGVLKPLVSDDSPNSLENPKVDAKGYLRVKPFKGALETLSWMKGDGFPTIRVVSKVEEKEWVKERVCRWLMHHGFGSVLSRAQVHFCYEWHEKAPICKRLCITHFVDDRLEVLRHLVGKVPHLFLFRPTHHAENKPHWHLVEDGRVILVRSWREIRAQLDS